ncbi:MAG TPA: hypothetical protein VE396_11750 [Xanthobacteraceae bacterium]|nr:hypothetical protein [Xanthobacteraceae bacterium]
MSEAELKKAEATAAQLEAKRIKLIARGVEIGDQRANVSYDAHASDNPKARAKLDAINAEIVVHASELASIEAAQKTAANRIATIKHQLAIAEDQAQARELREAVKVFVAAGEDLDEVLALLVTTSTAWREALYKVHSLGSAFPSDQQVLVLGSAAVSTSLMLTPFKRDFQHLAPGERRNAADLSRTWAATIERNIKLRLGETEQQQEAEHETAA